MSKPFPVENGMPSFWHSQPDTLNDHRSTDTLPETSDIVIIGAGFSGASTAYHCLEQSGATTKPSVVILEARQTCSGATGRNGGHLKPDLYNSIGALAAEYGADAAAEIAAFEVKNLEVLESFIKEENIDCDLEVSRVFDVQFNDAYCAKLKAGLDSLVANGVEISKGVEFSPHEVAETVSGVKGARGCFSSRAGRLWPYKLVMQLLRRAISAGANLQTHTPVVSVSESPGDDRRWTVTTPRGAIRAKWVIFASNAYTSAIAPEYKDRIVPVRGTCSHIVTPNPPVNPLLSSYSLRSKSWDYDYLIPRPDGSIVVGGGKSTYLHDLSRWYGNTDDSKLIDLAVGCFNDYMQRHYHGWEQTEAHVDQSWTGIMGYTADSLPHVGHIPEKRGQLVIAGFNGHGMPQVFLCAKGIAQMIVDGASYKDTGLPRLMRTSADRLQRKMDVKLALAE